MKTLCECADCWEEQTLLLPLMRADQSLLFAPFLLRSLGVGHLKVLSPISWNVFLYFLKKTLLFNSAVNIREINRLFDKALIKEIVISLIKLIHTFTSSNILFEQRRFRLGCPSLYQAKRQEETERQPI